MFGRRIRIAYVTVLILLFIARMWSVHGVHGFLGLDARHGEMVGIAGRLPGHSAEVMHAAFVRVYAPQTAADDIVDRAIAEWVAQHAKVSELLARVCAGDDALCTDFSGLEAQMLAVAESARAAAGAPPADRTAALGHLTELHGIYAAAADTWVDELAARFTAETKAQQHKLLLRVLAQILATALAVAVIMEPVIRRLQRERSDGDRIAERQSRLLAIVERAGSAVIISDPQGRIEWVNQGFVRLTGYPVGAVTGRHQNEVLCGEYTDPAARVALRAAIDAGSSCQVELLNHTRDGSAYWAHVDFQPIHSSSGVLTSFVAICTDVTERKRAQDVRHELLGRLQKMGSQLPGMVYQFRLRPDGTSHMPYSSEGIRQIFELSPESVREDATEAFALLHPDDLQRVRESIASSAAELTHWRDEYRLRLPNGRERWVLGNAAPEQESDGSVLWHGFITDVTERRNALQAIADARTLLQSVLDAATEAAIIATDVNGQITVFNSGAERMLQYQASEMVGCSDPLVVHLDHEVIARSRELTALYGRPVDGLETLTYPARKGEFSIRECTYVRKDGSRLTVSLSVTAIRNAAGDINGYLSIATDVTERRQARETLQAAKEAAERANRAKSEFLATMSHEIRTPMNGVLGFANLLRDTPLDDEQRDFVRIIERSGQNLLAIINDILDFSKIEAGAMTLEKIPFDLSDAVEEVVALMAGKAEEKQLELGLSIDPTVPERVVADPGRLKQILVNLIGNAIKFTSLGCVHVEVTTIGKDGNCELRISVHDTGIGISQTAQTALFQKFTQADASTTRRYGGTGLGLAICRQLIDLMGGKIGIDSKLGAGSTFWFTMPVAAISALESPTVPSEIAGRRVLIVDDVELNRRVLEAQLKGWGAECASVNGGRQALAALEQACAAGQPFDVALVDHLMPDVDGAELGEMLHADPRFGKLKLILLTSGEQLGSARELLERGFSAYLTKPVVRSRLLREAMGRALLPPSERLPKAAAESQARTEVAAPAASHLIRVLVAEDNSVNQMVAVRLLERLGCRVDVAGNGAEAVQMAARLPYSLVFMDCHMPEMDGFEATLKIRRRESDLGLPAMPIVALTASVLQEDRDRCVSAGMDGIIGKPVQPAELAQVLRRFAPKPPPGAEATEAPASEVPPPPR
jgi:PAS domain S-box-containing protein